MKLNEILRAIEAKAPASAAESWDNVGVLIGDPQAEITRATVCVDLLPETVERASQQGAQLIVNHHPCIFPKNRGLAALRAPSPVFEAARRGIAVVACHTNFDRCALDAVKAIAQALGVTPTGRLQGQDGVELLKLAVMVPESHAEAVRTAVCDAGAGHLGQYEHCTFTTAGEGTFRALPGANPTVGKVGALERVKEVKLETILPASLRSQVAAALRAAHPYEEIAYDLYPLRSTPGSLSFVRGVGYGLIGELAQPLSWNEWTKRVCGAFQTQGFLATALQPAQVKKVAFSPGKGSDFIDSAAAADCDVFVTGEVGYHGALAAQRAGLAVMELGHRESEHFFAPTVVSWLQEIGLPAAVLELPTQRFIDDERHR